MRKFIGFIFLLLVWSCDGPVDQNLGESYSASEGWKRNRYKSYFADSAYFHKDVRVNTELRIGTTGVLARLNDTVSFSDYGMLKHPNINAQTGTSYTLVLADDGKYVTMSNAAANTLTVPPNSSVAFPTGTQITVIQLGAGLTSIAAGSGVTIYSFGSNLDLGGQYAGASLLKTATNTWLLIGSLQ